MTDWKQFHPTKTLAAPDGQQAAIDVEMVPLIQQLWRLGIETKTACQDASEAVREGGTRVPAEERPAKAARLTGRAWLVVSQEDGPRLIRAWECLGGSGEWKLLPVVQENDPEKCGTITFPRNQIEAAARDSVRTPRQRWPDPASAHPAQTARTTDRRLGRAR
ncbi:hypothetical protein ACQEU3_37455 [Spirillospora sp. CA-253888]